MPANPEQLTRFNFFILAIEIPPNATIFFLLKRENNLKRLNLINCFGFAGISFFEQKKGPKKGPFY